MYPQWFLIEVEYWLQLHDQLSCAQSKTQRDHITELIKDQSTRLNYWRTVTLRLPSAL